MELFRNLLTYGRGEAVLILEKAPDKTIYRDAVIETALVDPRPDRQCDCSRGTYILDLLSCFLDGDRMLGEILEYYAEFSDTDTAYFYYMGNMNVWKETHPEAVWRTMQRMYTRLLQFILECPMKRDGIDMERDAFCHIAQDIARWKPEQIPIILQDQLALIQAGDRYGADDAAELLDRLPAAHAALYKEALRNIQPLSVFAQDTGDRILSLSSGIRRKKNKVCEEKSSTRQSAAQNWRDVLQDTSRLAVPRRSEKALFTSASPTEFADMAERVEKEEDPAARNKLIRYMNRYAPKSYFQNYPRDPAPLLRELASSAERPCPPQGSDGVRLRFLANYIGKIRHPAVRAYALANKEKMFSSDLVRDSSLVEMWMSNYIPEDADILLEFVTDNPDVEKIHGFGFTLLYDSPGVDMPQELLYYLYENTPCTICRCKALELIIEKSEGKRTAKDEAYIRESMRDCNPDARTFAASALKTAE